MYLEPQVQQPHHTLNHAEAQSGAPAWAVGAARLVEGIVNAGELIGRDTDARVVHFDAHAGAVREAAQSHASGPGVGDRIRYEVVKNLVDQRRIAAHARGGGSDFELQALARGKAGKLLIEPLEERRHGELG